MTTANHALTGAAIATAVNQPYLALPLAFLSHFACDSLPHFGVDFKFGKKGMYYYLLGDMGAALGFGILLLLLGVDQPVLLFFCAFAAMSPDLMWLRYGITHQLGNYSRYGKIAQFHHKIQWSSTVLPGILIEAAWAVLMFALILKLQ